MKHVLETVQSYPHLSIGGNVNSLVHKADASLHLTTGVGDAAVSIGDEEVFTAEITRGQNLRAVRGTEDLKFPPKLGCSHHHSASSVRVARDGGLRRLASCKSMTAQAP